MITLTTAQFEKSTSKTQDENGSKLLNFVELLSLFSVAATTLLLLGLAWV